jgi:hypothetical protein
LPLPTCQAVIFHDSVTLLTVLMTHLTTIYGVSAVAWLTFTAGSVVNSIRAAGLRLARVVGVACSAFVVGAEVAEGFNAVRLAGSFAAAADVLTGGVALFDQLRFRVDIEVKVDRPTLIFGTSRIMLQLSPRIVV